MAIHPVKDKFNSLALKSQAWTWALLRILGSAMFITHGWGKLFGDQAQSITVGMTSLNIGGIISIPTFINMLFIAGVIEVFGGLLILIGLFTRPIALIAAILMVFAYLIAHLAWFPTLNRGEAATLYFLLYMVIFAYGPGPCSVDAYLQRNREKPVS